MSKLIIWPMVVLKKLYTPTPLSTDGRSG